VKTGDWFDLTEGATALVVSVLPDGAAMVIDPYEMSVAPMRMELKGRTPMPPEEVGRRLLILNKSIEHIEAEGKILFEKFTWNVKRLAESTARLNYVKLLVGQRRLQDDHA
jgi:hypothetical protein